MFFILSKILVFLLKPVSWVVLLLAYTVFGRRARWKRRCLAGAFTLLLLFSNRFLFNLVVRWWEVDSLTMDQITEPYDIGILLGGYTVSGALPKDGRHNLSERGNRFVNTLELYHRGKVRRLLLSGGAGNLLGNRPPEAREAARFLGILGLPDSVLIREDQSRNTRENAVYTARLLRERHAPARCLLITSAWHMRRARACFARAGVAVTPFCVDYLSEEISFQPDVLLLPDANTLQHWEFLLKEWVGFLAYRLKGYA